MNMVDENRFDNGQRLLICRGIRGATTTSEDTRDAILEATRDLLTQIITANELKPEDIASVWFTTTPDLTAAFPAVAARQLGWQDVALMCSHEMNVPHALKRCVRVLIHWNTTRLPHEIRHIYLREAVNLRPDRSMDRSTDRNTERGLKQGEAN